MTPSQTIFSGVIVFSGVHGNRSIPKQLIHFMILTTVEIYFIKLRSWQKKLNSSLLEKGYIKYIQLFDWGGSLLLCKHKFWDPRSLWKTNDLVCVKKLRKGTFLKKSVLSNGPKFPPLISIWEKYCQRFSNIEASA